MSKLGIIAVVFILCVLNFVHAEVAQHASPVQLLDFTPNEEKTVRLMEDSIEKLFMDPLVYDRDVVVVSIAGAFRKGKSFLMNYMLRYLYANYKSVSFPNKEVNKTEAENWIGSPDEPLKGFPWKSSTKRETVGIVFWSDVFLYDSPNGGRIAIYLMDTQGLFDHNSSPTDNIRIFSLSALMSSVQMMNIFGTIEESHLEYLQFATEIARFTAVESDTNAKPFQNLMFIIRDWISPEEYEYGLNGGDKFIKSVLTVKNFHTAELKTVRQYLKKTFDKINCFLMPYPGKIVARNSSYNGNWKDIDEEFVDTMKELFPIILSPNNLIVKTINGAPIKAFELSVYVKQYVELFKSETMPEAKSIYDSTLDKQYQILISKCVELYLESISLYQEQITNKSEVDQLHEISMKIALKYFEDEKKFGANNDSAIYLKDLEEKLEKSFNEWKPVTLEFLESIKNEQKLAEEQTKLAKEAERRDLKAKKESKVADENYEDLKKKIEQIRSDSIESKREAEELRKRLADAEKQRDQAWNNEKASREYYEQMRRKAEAYENQLAVERQNNARRVQQRVVETRKRYGLLQWIGDGITGFFGFIGKAMKNLFHPA